MCPLCKEELSEVRRILKSVNLNVELIWIIFM